MILWQALQKYIGLNFTASLGGGLRVSSLLEMRKLKLRDVGALLQVVWPDIPHWLESPNSE